MIGDFKVSELGPLREIRKIYAPREKKQHYTVFGWSITSKPKWYGALKSGIRIEIVCVMSWMTSDDLIENDWEFVFRLLA